MCVPGRERRRLHSLSQTTSECTASRWEKLGRGYGFGRFVGVNGMRRSRTSMRFRFCVADGHDAPQFAAGSGNRPNLETNLVGAVLHAGPIGITEGDRDWRLCRRGQ